MDSTGKNTYVSTENRLVIPFIIFLIAGSPVISANAPNMLIISLSMHSTNIYIAEMDSTGENT